MNDGPQTRARPTDDGAVRNAGERGLRRVLRTRTVPHGSGSVGLVFALALIPLVLRDTYLLHIFVLAFIWLIVVAAWDLITGYGGVFSFGQIAFFVIGAYASGILTKSTSLSPWLGLLAGGLVAAVAGIAISLPCLRVRGVYVAVVTYALHLVLPTAILRGESFGTGGAGGLLGIPTLGLGGAGFSPLDKVPWFYTGLGLAAVSVYLIYFRLLRSPFGLGLRALRDSEDLAQSLGVNEYRTKVTVFAASAFFTGVAGAFYAHYTGSLSQRLLGMDLFLLIMIMLTVGGMGRYPGAVLGTFIFTFANEFLRISGSLRLIITGGIIIVAILALPEGLVQAGDIARRRLRRPGGGARSEPGGEA